MKKCSKCGWLKELSEFNARTLPSGNAGYQSPCRECNARARKEHPTSKEYRIKWMRANPDKVAASILRYKKTEKYRAKVKRQSQKRKPARRVYQRNRYRTDPEYRLGILLRRRLHESLKRTSTHKCAGTFELLGCRIEELRIHLERNFKSGMTWENHGPVWHVDHIKPCAAFDLTDPEQQRICFHWANLQPLFAQENIKKSDKYAH